MKGWVKIHRELCSHELWLQEKFTRGQAWIDLILLANHNPGYVRKRQIRINLDRGQLGWSIKSLADRWQWSINKAKRFINELEFDRQISTQKTNVSTTITIMNYDKYQSANESANEFANESQTSSQTNRKRVRKRIPNKNVNNEKNGEEGEEVIPKNEILELFEMYSGEQLNGRKPTKVEEKYLQSALDDKNLEAWKPYIIVMCQLVNNNTITRPPVQFFFTSDYQKFTPNPRFAKVLKECPKGCKQPKPITAGRHIDNFCRVCGEMMVEVKDQR